MSTPLAHLHWPQIIYILLLTINLVYVLANHGRPQPKYNFAATLIATVIGATIIWWGGFFSPC